MSTNLPHIIPRAKHNISRVNINQNALKVLYRLKNEGYCAYLVGGAVRDLLLGLTPKDFDIATNAFPEKVRKAFRNCMLIGRRFRLAHIRFGREIIEVATFRAAAENIEAISEHRRHSEHGMILRDNVYGTLEEDAMRRDFTINSLYYNIADFSLVDFTDGLKDLKHKIIRVIGDPEVRFHEDPVRMLRAIRMAAVLGFSLDKKIEGPIKRFAGLLQNVPAARLYDEILKWFEGGKSLEGFELGRKYGIFAVLFPQTEASLGGKSKKIVEEFLRVSFLNTDKRVQEGRPLNPAFLFAALLWWPLRELVAKKIIDKQLHPNDALLMAMKEVLDQQKVHICIPYRLMLTIKEIWFLQYRFEQKTRRKVYYAFLHLKFKIAYDFLLLRTESGEEVKDLTDWWSKFLYASDQTREKMIGKLNEGRRHSSEQ